jgi:uncharacterized protein YjiS (DUF1127 family)
MSNLIARRLVLIPRLSLRTTWRLWRLRRKTRATLARLDDHLLADIGLNREAAAYEAARPFWQQ